MSKGFFRQNAIGILALAMVVTLAIYTLKDRKSTNGIAFVDTNRLMTSFKEAHAINKEIEAEDKKWKEDLRIMNDSLKSFMDTMTVKFDAADVSSKRAMQDKLAAMNQQINNFERTNIRRLQQVSQEKLAKVYEKINAFMKDYGKSEGYLIIFGTSPGTIIYGDGSSADITAQVIEALNKRYP